MKYQILLQKAPFTVRATITRRDSAERAAQIIANTRGEFLAVCRDDRPAVCGCVKNVAPAGYVCDPYSTYTAKQWLAGKPRLWVRLHIQNFARYQRKCGRALAYSIALFRDLYRQHAPGFVRIVKDGNQLRALFSDGRLEYVATASWFDRADGRVFVERDFRSAWVHPDGTQTRGFYTVVLESPTAGRFSSQTSFGGERRPAAEFATI